MRGKWQNVPPEFQESTDLQAQTHPIETWPICSHYVADCHELWAKVIIPMNLHTMVGLVTSYNRPLAPDTPGHVVLKINNLHVQNDDARPVGPWGRITPCESVISS